jgi:zinc protease
MKIRIEIYLSVILFVLYTQVVAQTKFIEKVVQNKTEMVIPYEKYQLSNGLTILIHEDHSVPVVYVSVMYHVGSAREQEGRSGFAHFFEHMMFEGSEHISGGMHSKIITEAGGKFNGDTNRDRTNYWELLPSNQLETALWLESDRMGFLIDAVTQQKFEIQRETVMNERAQNYDNRPFGLINEKTCESLYPSSHPYAWQTIGYSGDLKNVNVKDLKDFFMRWYGPNNATLTIAGDVTSKEAVAMVEKYFGSIPTGPAVKQQEVTPILLEDDRYISYDDHVRFPQVMYTFPTVKARHVDEPALDVLADILGEGKSSVFYQYFIKSEDAENVNISHPCYELAGEFKIRIYAKRLKHFDKMIKEAFAEFEKKGVSDEDLEKHKIKFEAQKTDQMLSVEGKGELLSFYQTTTDNPNYISKDIERYSKVTKEDVMRVYTTYIKDKHAVVLSVYPTENSSLVKKDNYTPPARNRNAEESPEYKNLTYVKAKDNFDRNIQPTPVASPIVKVPDFWIDSLPNGLKVIGTKSEESPVVFMKISIPIGHRFENKKNAGISELIALLLKESTLKFSSEEMDSKLNQLGSEITINSGIDELIINVSSLTRNVDATLALVEEVVMHPKFDDKEFDIIQKKQIALIKSGAINPYELPNDLIKSLWYGKNNILGSSKRGTQGSVGSISADEAKEYYEKYSNPTRTSVVFVGNLEQKDVMAKLSFLESWTTANVLEPTSASSAGPIVKTAIYFLNRPNAAQSQIRVGCTGLAFDATGDYFKSLVATYILGGPFNSKINLNLREEHGYCYSAYASFHGTKYPGPYIIEANVKTGATESSLLEIMKEIKKYVDTGITKEELAFTQNSMTLNELLKYETPSQKAGFLKTILDHNLSKDFTAQQNNILKSISLDEVNTYAKKSLPYNNMILLIIGDKAKVYGKLLNLGYEVNEINFDGTPLY